MINKELTKHKFNVKGRSVVEVISDCITFDNGCKLYSEHESDCCESHLKLGHPVPDFEIDTYDPPLKNFGKISLAEQKKAGKWTILFFYPADFTFV